MNIIFDMIGKAFSPLTCTIVDPFRAVNPGFSFSVFLGEQV